MTIETEREGRHFAWRYNPRQGYGWILRKADGAESALMTYAASSIAWRLRPPHRDIPQLRRRSRRFLTQSRPTTFTTLKRIGQMIELGQTWTHPEYTAHVVTVGRWSAKPKLAVAVQSSDGSGWKTRAISILEQFKPYYSHRRGYVVSPQKFAKFQAEMAKLD